MICVQICGGEGAVIIFFCHGAVVFVEGNNAVTCFFGERAQGVSEFFGLTRGAFRGHSKTLMSNPRVPEGLSLATLLCRRICHDLANPLGAIINGLELLEKTPDMDVLQASAARARAHLEVLRLAFSLRPGSMFALVRASPILNTVAVEQEIQLRWNWVGTVQSEIACLLVNMVLTAFFCLPRGGVVTTQRDVYEGSPRFRITGEGRWVKVLEKTAELLLHPEDAPPNDSRHATAYLAGRLASVQDIPIGVESTPGRFEFWVILRPEDDS